VLQSAYFIVLLRGYRAAIYRLYIPGRVSTVSARSNHIKDLATLGERLTLFCYRG